MEQQNRQLAAILFTDIVGYTSMMQKDEQMLWPLHAIILQY
jgi:class 3 adenylate cyclase